MSCRSNRRSASASYRCKTTGKASLNALPRLMLDKELMNQEEKKRVKEAEKLADRDAALREAQLKQLMDEAAREADKTRKAMVGEELKQTIDLRQRLAQEQKRAEFLRDQENLESVMRQKAAAEQAELEKKRVQREMLFAGIDQSRRQKLLRDEAERAREQEVEERAKNNHTYFSGHDQRQREYQERLRNFEEQQRRVRDNY